MTDYTKTVEALRECANWIEAVAASSQYAHDELVALAYGDKLRDAADAIEALQAEVPKRGEWIGVNPMVDTVQCSICGGQLFSAELETPYCPYCGAKMEVQE